MFASKKPSLNEWKNWAIGLVGNTMSSIDQATSRWFLNLINGLPRDYFAKTFDQVNYLDKRVWEGMFRARIDEIKEQLELGVSESVFEADLVKLQGLIGKYSLSPVTYENGLEELEDFISSLGNGDNYLKILREARNEFREELKSQPVLLKECIESEVNLERKEGACYKSLLDDRSLKNTSPERVISESPILDKAAVSKRGNNNYKLRNISKLLFSNPGQALTLFLAAQSAFASAANIQMSNSTGLAIGNDTLSFDNNLSNLSEFEERINENVSLHSISKSGNFRNSNKVRKEVEVVERGLNGRFTEIRDEFKDLRDTGELVEVLTYVKSQRFKRAANESLSEMETVPEDQGEVIVGLENKVRELNEEIEQLKNSISASDSSYKKRIASIEGQKAILQGSLDNLKKQSGQELSAKANEIQGLNAMVGNFKKDIEDLKEQIAENERKYLYVECAKDIEVRKFKDAEEKLKQISNETGISDMVNHIYSSQINSFSLLFDFAKGLQSVPLKLSVFNALGNKLRRTCSGDIFEVIELVKFVKSDVLEQQNANSDTRRRVDDLLNSLKGLISSMAVKELSGAIKNKTYAQGERNVFKISNVIFLLETQLFKELITNVIDDVYGKVDTDSTILDFIWENADISQRVYQYEALLEKMKVQNHLNHGRAVLELARCVRNLINGADYVNLPQETQNMILKLKDGLPEMIRIAVFAKKVCIKNVEYGGYINVPRRHITKNELSRFFDRESLVDPQAWVTQKDEPRGYWIFQSYKDGYFTIMDARNNQYLYTSDAVTVFERREKVGSTDDCHKKEVCMYGHCALAPCPDVREVGANSGEVSDDRYWEILNFVNGVKIRNKYHANYFLYASDLIGSERGVHSAVPSSSSKFIWKLEDCSDKQRRRRDTGKVQSYSEPSSYLGDIVLEKTKESNSSSIAR